MNSKIGSDLALRLKSVAPHDLLDVVVFLKEETAAEALSLSESGDVPRSREEIVEFMKSAAEKSQQGLLDAIVGLSAEAPPVDDIVSIPQARLVDRFWINNSVRLQITRAVLEKILERDEVRHAELVTPTDINELLDERPLRSELSVPPELSTDTTPLTWSLQHINAPLMWQAGFLGQDIVVAVIDTGVNSPIPTSRTECGPRPISKARL